MKRKKRKPVMKRLGILEKVEEVGIERFMSSSPAPSSIDEERSDNFWANLAKEQASKHKPDLLSDELEEIEPGTLTVSRGATNTKSLGDKKPKQTSKKDSPVAGQLKPPSFNVYAGPNLSPSELGKLPLVMDSDYRAGFPPVIPGAVVGGRGPGRVISPCEKRPNLPGMGLGIPGQPGTGALRTDLGFVPVTSASVNRYYRAQSEPEETSFIGSIAQMFFGRKGGLF